MHCCILAHFHFLLTQDLLLNSVLPRINPRMQSTIKIKNNVLAIPAAPDAIPVNPKTAAMSAITKKIADHFNMTLVFRV